MLKRIGFKFYSVIKIAVMAVTKQRAIYLCLVVFSFFVMFFSYSFYIGDYYSSSKKPMISFSSFSHAWNVSRKEIEEMYANEFKASRVDATESSIIDPTPNTAANQSPLKIILMWNAWTSHMADKPLVKGQCPVKSCLFTTDMSLMQQSDVVVLHFDTLEDYPVNREPHQRFVFYHFESPDNTASELMNDSHFRYNYFNWTMTYRRDSDIYLRDYYGSLITKASIKNNSREMRYNYGNLTGYNNNNNNNQMTDDIDILPGMELVKNNLNLTALIQGKTKMVTWFVGHCSTPVRREEYVRQLSQYVSVDIYGNCTKDCPYHCDEMLRAEYKFYLAFENSWCPDYVTEKFIRPFVYDAIPIFLGGADYSKYAPPNSYINAREFNSPKELADYLILLDKSDQLYARYFDWKRDYYVSVPDFYGWCELCRMAHDDTLPIKVYKDIKKWWMVDAGECESNTTKYF